MKSLMIPTQEKRMISMLIVTLDSLLLEELSCYFSKFSPLCPGGCQRPPWVPALKYPHHTSLMFALVDMFLSFPFLSFPHFSFFFSFFSLADWACGWRTGPTRKAKTNPFISSETAAASSRSGVVSNTASTFASPLLLGKQVTIRCCLRHHKTRDKLEEGKNGARERERERETNSAA